MDPVTLSLLAAAIPTVLGGIGSLFGPSAQPEQVKQIPNFNPQQQQALSQLLQRGLSGLQAGQGSFDFGPIEERARRDFQTKTVPSIAERFSSLGSNKGSSGLASQSSGARADLESNLANLRAQYGFEESGRQQNQLFNLLGLGLKPQFESIYRPETPSSFQTYAAGAGGHLLNNLPSLFGQLSQFGGNNQQQQPQFNFGSMGNPMPNQNYFGGLNQGGMGLFRPQGGTYQDFYNSMNG